MISAPVLQQWGAALAAPPPLAVVPAPYAYLCLDIETANGRPEDAERFIRLAYQPEAFGTWKEDTIGKRVKEAYESKRAALALLDEAPIKIVALRSDTELRCLHSCFAEPPSQRNGGLVEGFPDDRALLVALRNLLDALVGPETILVGHNILQFDLKHLRHAFLREHVRLPRCLVPGCDQPVFDCMTKFMHHFSGKFKDDEGRPKAMPSVADLLEEFRIPAHKQVVDGAAVPDMLARGECEPVIQYAMLDVLAECELYLRMTGQGGGLQ